MDDQSSLQTFVVYRSKSGEKYHRSPVCALGGSGEVGPYGTFFDYSELEMDQIKNIEGFSPTDLCKNCASMLRSSLYPSRLRPSVVAGLESTGSDKITEFLKSQGA